MARRSPTGRFPALRQGQRRESLWLASVWTNNSLGAAAVNLLLSLNAAALALRPFTVVRTRGFLHLGSDQIANTESQAVVYGVITVSEQASAAGVASVPTPITESGSDWHVYEPMATRFVLSSAVGIDAQAGFGMKFDSKAMRKVDLGEDLITVVEVGASGPSDGVIFRSYQRTLIKLH